MKSETILVVLIGFIVVTIVAFALADFMLK